MSSTTSGNSTMSKFLSKKTSSASNSSTSGTNTNTQRATSDDDMIHSVQAPLARESSSGFNYQTLTETSPLAESKSKTRPPVRSLSSNAELGYHLHQIKNLNKRRPTLGGDDRNKNEDRIHLTSSNLKIVCNENGKQASTVELQTIEANIDLLASWKPPIPPQAAIPRDAWDHKIEFLLAVIGYAVDLGNVWRFPTTVYKNGGGAFFIPYFILLIFGGLPLFYMELALGQYHRAGVFTIWKHICPLVKGIGWATVLINFMTATFYNTIISWAVYYLVMSFNGLRTELPWKSCDHEWNTKCCVAADVKQYEYLSQLMNLTDKKFNISGEPTKNCTRLVYSTEEYFYRRLQEVDKADGFNNLGKIKWELAISLLVVFVLVYFALWKGIKSSGKAVWITAIAPYAVLFILLIRGVTLSGSSIGIKYYLRPNMELLKDFSIWNAAATQIFFSLGPGFGVLLALSSYNKFNNNCYRDALVTSTINCATSILAGFVIFSTLGHMASVSRKTIEEVIEDKGSELVFIVYPHTIALMNWSTLWAVLFFFMVITLGIDSTFGGLESIITGLCDEFPNLFGRHRSLFVLGVLIICYLGALPTCTYGGDYIVTLMNEIAVAPAILLVVFIECIAVSWFYGVNRFSFDIKSMIGSRPSLFWRVIWYLISPIFLFIIFYIAMSNFLAGTIAIKTTDLKDLPFTIQVWSYLMVFLPMLCIPGYAIYKLIITPGKTFDERLQRAVTPEEPILELIQYRLDAAQKQQQKQQQQQQKDKIELL
ncbi:unnamed protein product [Rotaria socialis]|uniref:Transporter n=2 Tax=Rotaria socialis TaxID=392032 RepID=A0A818EV68_9BILA|nr:unnamed protein product [Rotaria socialis]CAF3458967.1 unnamed protein product [Rotaria socialis]CAF3464946.1 unnamed protein product [Rotaria socialis]CAF3474243.1 unnamed protein product [Rotaria socialis]CAF4383646.1 unnamed protein product [Rotaria socialis]